MSSDDTARRGHEEYDQLAVGWAVKALEPDDEARFARHLTECVRCTDTVQDAQELCGELALSLRPEEPPAGLRARILAAAASEPRLVTEPASQTAVASGVGHRRRTGSTAGRGPGRGGKAPVGPGGQRGGLLAAGRLSRRSTMLARAMAMVGALALIVGLGVWNVELRSEATSSQTVAAAQAQVIGQLNDGGIYRVAPLQNSDGSSVGMVVVHDGAAKVMSAGLPINDHDTQTLVLWGLRPSLAPVPLGTFDVVQPSLDVRTVSSTSTGLDQYQGYAVSVESGRSAPTRPTELVATGTVGS